jgi:predicted nuclease of restriction endonuclease-like (RecB) superfamily
LQQPAAKLTAVPILPQLAAKLEQQTTNQEVTSILPPVVAKLNAASIVKQPATQLAQHTTHQEVTLIVPQVVAQLTDSPLWDIPWIHHVILMEKIKSPEDRLWYMRQILANGWSRTILSMQIEKRAHKRHGAIISNFAQVLPPPQSDLVQQTLKDPYIFDFLTLEEPFHERELETHLVRDVQKFLIELGQGFAFVGRQYRLDVADEDFYIDLLFYHLRLRAFVVIDLKKGKFKPEYAGKLNFYCSVVNDRLKHPTDQPTIGLILCQERNRLLAEYSFANIDKPIGIATYQLTRAFPKEIRSALPTVEELEAELSGRLKKTPSKHISRVKPKVTRNEPI